MAVPLVLEIHPRDRVGPLRLGAPRAEARAAIEAVPVAFGRTVGGETSADAFFDLALQVFYDAEDRVEYVEVERDPAVTPILFGRPVLTLPLTEVVELIGRHAAHDPEAPGLPDCWSFPELDLALWEMSELGARDGCFGTVGAGRAGYLTGAGARTTRC